MQYSQLERGARQGTVMTSALVFFTAYELGRAQLGQHIQSLVTAGGLRETPEQGRTKGLARLTTRHMKDCWVELRAIFCPLGYITPMVCLGP